MFKTLLLAAALTAFSHAAFAEDTNALSYSLANCSALMSVTEEMSNTVAKWSNNKKDKEMAVLAHIMAGRYRAAAIHYAPDYFAHKDLFVDDTIASAKTELAKIMKGNDPVAIKAETGLCDKARADAQDFLKTLPVEAAEKTKPAK